MITKEQRSEIMVLIYQLVQAENTRTLAVRGLVRRKDGLIIGMGAEPMRQQDFTIDDWNYITELTDARDHVIKQIGEKLDTITAE